MSFEWLSLDDFFDEIRKSLNNNDLSKADVPVHPYTKDVGGQHVQVRQHTRHVISTPEMDAGHVKHFVPPDGPKNAQGGMPQAEPTPIVPGKKEKKEKEKKVYSDVPPHVTCPHCHPSKAAPAADGAPDGFKYAPPKLPIAGKTKDQITMNDIAGSLHKHRFLQTDQRHWHRLPLDEQEEHVKNHNLIHMTPDAMAALKGRVERMISPYMINNLKRLNLDKVGVDTEDALAHFRDRIIDEMRTHYRAGQEHDYALHDTPEYAAAKKRGEPVGRWFHQGIDPNKINTGKDLETFIRSKANDKWPIRIINKELNTGYSTVDKNGKQVPLKGYKDLLGSKEILEYNEKNKAANTLQHEMRKLEQEHGVGEMSIDPTLSYDLKSLEKIAGNNNYVLEQHGTTDGSKIDRIVISDYSTGTAKPVAEVDLGKGGLNDLRNKLAAIVNPLQANEGPTPFKTYMDLSKKYEEVENRAKSTRQDYNEAKERYDMAAVSPEEHLKSIENYSANAINIAESLDKEVNDPVVNQIITRVTEASEQVTQGNDYKRAENETKMAFQAAKELATKHQSANTVALASAIDKLYQDISAYREKASIPEAQREQRLEKLFGTYKDKEEDVESKDAQLSDMKDEIAKLSLDPAVDQYKNLQDQHKGLQDELEVLKPKAQSRWKLFQQHSFQEAGEGENDKGGKQTADSLDSAAGSSATNRSSDASDQEWYEKVPDDIDFNDEKQATDAAKKLLEAYKHVHRPGEFIFGDNPNVAKGIMHVAEHYMNTSVKQDVNDFVKNLHKEYPPSKGVPPPFLQGAGNGVARRFAHKLFRLNPNVVAHYAMKFSDYAPVPYNTDDVYENQVKDESSGKPYFHVLMSDIAATEPNQKNLEPVLNETGDQVAWKLKHPDKWHVPTRDTFQYQYFKLLRELGNAAVQESMKKRPDIAPVLDLIRELNHPPKKQSHASAIAPGTLRRDLQRRMDVFYGQTFGKYPKWHHKLPPEDEQKWINSLRNITPDKEEKSLVVYEEVLRKAVKLIIKL